MVAYKHHATLEFGRNIRLVLNVDVGTTGLGGLVNRLALRPTVRTAPTTLEAGTMPARLAARVRDGTARASGARVPAAALPSGKRDPVQQQLLEQLEQIRQQLASKNRELKQVRHELARERELVWQIIELRNENEKDIPIPPLSEIFLVTGTKNAAWFLKSGEFHAQSIRKTLEKNGLDIEEFDSILDFGCGVGRITRHWSALEKPAVHGTDYNPDLIAWCQENLAFGRFQVNDLVGSLKYENEKFDFIYAWSVFTHLTEPQQFHWIEELSRVLRPGGHLFITTQGDYHLRHLSHLVNLPQAEEERFRNGNLVVIRESEAGSNRCAAFHPERYVRENLAESLELIDFVPGGAHASHQDAYLLRNPSRGQLPIQ